MSDKVYKLVEIVGVSQESFSKAVDAGVAKAGDSLRHIDWFEVTEMRGRVVDGKVAEYQVKLKVGFRLE